MTSEQLGAAARASCAASRLPDVLADQQADAKALNSITRRLRPGPKVALLVEDLVVGQFALAVVGDERAIARDSAAEL